MSSDKIEIKDAKTSRSLVATEVISGGEVILEFARNFRENSSKYSLQVGKDFHQYNEDPEAKENFIEHSCNPNGYVDFDSLSFRAIRKIKPGEELNFNYLCTELELDERFKCECGANKCYGVIKGFKYLSEKKKKELGPYVSPFLKERI